MFKYLDKHYPISKNYININYDPNPNELIEKVFGIKTNDMFEEWAKQKVKGKQIYVRYDKAESSRTLENMNRFFNYMTRADAYIIIDTFLGDMRQRRLQ